MKVPKPRKLSSGKWFIQLRLGGESVSISDYSKKECLRQAQLIKAEYLAGKRQKQMNPAPESPTLSEAVDRYIAQRSNTLSPATIRGYRTIQRNRFQEQMSRRLDQIAPEDWQGIVNQEAARCGPKTLKNAWGFKNPPPWNMTAPRYIRKNTIIVIARSRFVSVRFFNLSRKLPAADA